MGMRRGRIKDRNRVPAVAVVINDAAVAAAVMIAIGFSATMEGDKCQEQI